MEQSPESIAQALKDLRSGLFYGRRNAAETLGKLDESSGEIVKALLVARDSDANDEVRDAAAAALQAPVHQGFLLAHPGVLRSANEVTVEVLAQQAREEIQAAAENRVEKKTSRWGFWAIGVGVMALILQAFGLTFSLLSPEFGFILIIVGASSLFFGNRTPPSVRPVEEIETALAGHESELSDNQPCPHCGSYNPPNAIHCADCGEKI
jgi:hypothetical protein